MDGNFHSPIEPLPPTPSAYGADPETIKKRACELPDIVSVHLNDLFPDFPESIYNPNKPETLEAVREATWNALEKVDVSMIMPGESVNILGSHHGFTILGGAPYAEMLKTLKDFLEEEIKDVDVRLKVGVGLRFREADEHIKRLDLDKYFDGKAKGIAPIDAGVPIETKIGTLYGIREAYNADHIVHAHNSDVREIHFHRHVDRAVKPFGMSYARIETRSTYHHNLGPRGANFVARAIFESDIVQKKWTFSSFLVPFPGGVRGVDADNDLYELNKRLTLFNFKHYGKVIALLSQIDEAITILDFQCPIPYVFAAGVIFANFSAAGKNIDIFDLDQPVPGYTWYTEAFYDKNEKPLVSEVPQLNPGIKALIINYAWGGYPSVFWAKHLPTIVVGEQQAEVFGRDPQNIEFMEHAVTAEDLDSAVEFAQKFADTDKILIFDGVGGGINVSKPLAEELLEKAPEVAEKVEKELIPKWKKQRNLG